MVKRNLAEGVTREAVVETAQGTTPDTLYSAEERLTNCRHLQPKDVRYAGAKRAVDLVVGIFVLLLLLPVFLVVALLVKCSDGGPVFYKSTRIGLCGKPITFWKFRTMCVNAEKLLNDLKDKNEKEGPIFKIKADPRVTPVGRVLRRFSLDELPQLFSVLTGEMSLVGPRPMLPHEVAQFEGWQLERFRVKPGITCFWQVMGRSKLSFEEWMELDHRYVQEMSFWLDLRLLALTPKAVLSSDGSY